MSSDQPAPPGGAPKIAFIAALALECASLRRQLQPPSRWQVFQSGPGSERAAAAAISAVEGGAGLLVSWGLVGGLAPGVAPGTIVLPRRVLSRNAGAFPTDASWRLRLAALVGESALEQGDLLTAATAIESPAAKRAAAAETGATAVDMEAAAIAAVAQRTHVPFVALRVVVDGVDDALPAGAEAWIDEHGNRRPAAALRAAVSPRQWGTLVMLAKRFRVASRALERLAATLASRPPLAESAAEREAEA